MAKLKPWYQVVTPREDLWEKGDGDRHMRWRGVIPAQKWMNFYTKVLSKFATSSDLNPEISFEVKVDREQAESKLGETKSAVRELGLDDNVTL